MIRFYGVNDQKELIKEIEKKDGFHAIDVNFESVAGFQSIVMEWSQKGLSTIQTMKIDPEFQDIEVSGTEVHDDSYLWIFNKKENALCWKLNGYQGELRIRFVMRMSEDPSVMGLICETEQMLSERAVRQKLIDEHDDLLNSTFWKMSELPRRVVDRVREKDFSLPARLNPFKPNFVSKTMHISQERRNQEHQYKFQNPIRFSILVPLYNTPSDFLSQMISSVIAQTYDNWQLCLADASDSNHTDVEKTVNKYMHKDSRIQYRRLAKNGGISWNTNQCMEMADGDYFCLLDHDDLLHPSALFETMKKIEETNAQVVYTDEAIYDGRKFVGIHYKPDYSPETLLGCNYITHFLTFSKKLLDETGGFNEIYDGAQDHEFILRMTDCAEVVSHIPQVLYFWRSHAGSTAQNIDTKPYAVKNGQKAVKDFLQKRGLDCEVRSTSASKTIYHVYYPIINQPKVSVIIPNKNKYTVLKNCISSILTRTIYPNYEIVIVDNGSDETDVLNYYDLLKKQYRNIEILHYDYPFNYAAMNNYAVKNCHGDYVLLLNNDTEVISPDWMNEMLMHAQMQHIGCVGARLFYPNNTIQHAGVTIGTGTHGVATHSMLNLKRAPGVVGYMARDQYVCNVMAVTAACLMVKKSLFDQVGGFDEERFAVAYNDVDLCLKVAQTGRRNVYNGFVELYHYESISRGYDLDQKNIDRFLREVNAFHEKWDFLLEKGDPYYNVNLSDDGAYHTPEEVL